MNWIFFRNFVMEFVSFLIVFMEYTFEVCANSVESCADKNPNKLGLPCFSFFRYFAPGKTRMK